uniref:cobyrinate a,c-diamide synthase n=1 Tax=Cupriavidus yeoncheonensis TaxID=1462994 RepID=UPI003F494295
METGVRTCPALFITAPASHQGKTTVTAGLARYHRNRGRSVRVFKTGPDFLDPFILEHASGNPVHSLDLWMTGEADCRRRLYEAAGQADLILIEGCMGLFDGSPSSASLATAFGVPVLPVIDANAMAQTFGAIAYGLASLQPGLPFHGVLANRVAGTRHAEMLRELLPSSLRCVGALMQDEAMGLPERHLGLVQAQEIGDLETRVEAAAMQIATTTLGELPPAVAFAPAIVDHVPRLLEGVTIAIARDEAFSFLYPANLDVLSDLGARVIFFSPLADELLPEADAVYLPGGYPELHLDRLAASAATKVSMQAHVAAGRPVYAECGGMLYLLDSLTDLAGMRGTMLGLMPGEAKLQKRLGGIGLQAVELEGGTLRGHTFHYSLVDTPLAPHVHARRANGGALGEAVYRYGSIVATYMHCYFPSDPAAVARLFRPDSSY